MKNGVTELWLSEEMKNMRLNTLFIIGNGFDINHGIKSKYSDFREWLEVHGDKNLIFFLEYFFSNTTDVWSNLEEALGTYNEEDMLDFYNPKSEINYDRSYLYVDSVTDMPKDVVSPNIDLFKEYYKEWVESVDISCASKKFNLSNEALYLNFNYTDTLETVYNIMPSNILHIHGSRLNKDEYIVGHNCFRNPLDTYDESKLYFESDALSRIIEFMNSLRKNPEDIIKRNENFFFKLSNIQQIIVYGHSMSSIDWPYFKKIIDNVSKGAIWIVSFHSSDDIDNIRKFENKYNIKVNLIPM